MTLETLRKKLLSDPETQAFYDELKPEFDLAKELISMRKALGLTQRELAEKTGIKQPQLARIESGKQSPRLDTLAEIAGKVGYSVEVRIVPNRKLPQHAESSASRRAQAAPSKTRKAKSNLKSKEALEPV